MNLQGVTPLASKARPLPDYGPTLRIFITLLRILAGNYGLEPQSSEFGVRTRYHYTNHPFNSSHRSRSRDITPIVNTVDFRPVNAMDFGLPLVTISYALIPFEAGTDIIAQDNPVVFHLITPVCVGGFGTPSGVRTRLYALKGRRRQTK